MKEHQTFIFSISEIIEILVFLKRIPELNGETNRQPSVSIQLYSRFEPIAVTNEIKIEMIEKT